MSGTPRPRVRARRRARALFAAAHPVPSVAVTAMVTMLALRAGAGRRSAVVATAVLAGQLSIGWLNDWRDAERDLAADRRDKPVAGGRVSRAAVGRAAAVSGVLAAVIAVPLGAAGAVNLVHVAAGYVYDLWAKTTRASVVPYVVAFGLFPAVASLAGRPPGWPPAWMLVAGALLGAGGHVMNVLPDLDDDRRTGVRGFPQWLGRRASLLAATAFLGGGALVAAVAVTPPEVRGVVAALTGLLVIAVITTAAHGRTALAFRLTIALALATVGLLWVADPT